MLLNNSEMTDTLYNPTIHLTQTELMEKFNLAFYEGQNLSKSDILSTFQDHNNLNTINNDNYLIDYLMSDGKEEESTFPQHQINNEIDNNNENCSTYFDFNDFVDIFDRNLLESSETPTETTEETETTISGTINSDYDQFLTTTNQSIDFDDIDLSEALSQSSIDFDNLTNDIQDLDEIDTNILPPINTITRNNIDFNNFIRSVPDNNLFYAQPQQIEEKNEFGHLINHTTYTENYETNNNNNTNQIILLQNEATALLHQTDDPLLSSSSLMYPKRRKISSSSDESNLDLEQNDEEEMTTTKTLICQWENCYQIYDSQSNLVKHIEKCHVEVKRGDEFTCYWSNCPRKIKPFNARYKLLIHMRVHSGEKPNKCPFQGCNKAFSRLENLKIHQRSHTGERPYLCQFPTCTKSFSNSSDRAKHQRTHFDTKPYACQVVGCTKKYTDPSSLRKHVKNHTNEEQMLIKKKPTSSTSDEYNLLNNNNNNSTTTNCVKKYLDLNRQKAIKPSNQNNNQFYTNFEHNYSNNINNKDNYCKFNNSNNNSYCSNSNLISIKQDLKNKISEKNKLKNKLVMM